MRRHVTLTAIVLILLAGAGWAAPADLSKDAWMGVYLGPTKIGYMHTTISNVQLLGMDV